MIQVTECAGSNNRVIILVMPHKAMPWRWLITIYSILAVVSLAIAIYLYTMGLTLVLPFSGFELALLGAALYITARNSGVREVITVDEDMVIVECGRTAPVSAVTFPRHRARLVLTGQQGWYPSRLMLRAYGRQLELAHFVNEEERRGLAKTLAFVLGQRLETR